MSTCKHGHIEEACFICLAERKARKSERRDNMRQDKLIRLTNRRLVTEEV